MTALAVAVSVSARPQPGPPWSVWVRRVGAGGPAATARPVSASATPGGAPLSGDWQTHPDCLWRTEPMSLFELVRLLVRGSIPRTSWRYLPRAESASTADGSTWDRYLLLAAAADMSAADSDPALAGAWSLEDSLGGRHDVRLLPDGRIEGLTGGAWRARDGVVVIDLAARSTGICSTTWCTGVVDPAGTTFTGRAEDGRPVTATRTGP